MKQTVDLSNNIIRTTLSKEEYAAMEAVTQRTIIENYKRDVKLNRKRNIKEAILTIGVCAVIAPIVILGLAWLNTVL